MKLTSISTKNEEANYESQMESKNTPSSPSTNTSLISEIFKPPIIMAVQSSKRC